MNGAGRALHDSLPDTAVPAGPGVYSVLGPGFTVGAGTLVTPQAAAVGALPMFPLLAALPDNGPARGMRVTENTSTPGGLTILVLETTGPAAFATYEGVSSVDA